MIKAVIFDADGPLYHRSDNVLRQKQTMLARFGYHGSMRDFEAAYDTHKFKGYIGTLTIPELLRTILRDLGITLSAQDAIDCAQAFNAIQRQVTATDSAIATLRRLKERGYMICVLTDSLYSSAEKWSWFESMGMHGYIDHLISSFDIRQVKRSPQAYQYCLNTMGITPDEAVFVGHQQYEMIGAQAAHVTSIAVTPIAAAGTIADHDVHSIADIPRLLHEL